VSVLGGGHSYTCESARPGTIQLDMRRFDKITADWNRFELTTQTGVVFSEVLKVVKRTSHAIAHGGCHSVGTAGFFLHGGIHAPSTRLVGRGNDTIVSMTVVTYDGSVRTLSNVSSDQSLWKAMRLGGSHFGIATSITARFLASESEASSFIFVISLTTEEFASSWARIVRETHKNGNLADVTFDGAGPARLTRLVSEQFDPSSVTVQLSIRNNRGTLGNSYPIQLARAVSHMVSSFPLRALPTMWLAPFWEDQSLAYDATTNDWTSTFMCVPADCSIETILTRLTDHFRSYAYYDAQWACWQVISTTTSFDDKMCFEYNCPDVPLFRRELPKIDDFVKETCSGWTRYSNVKSPEVPTSEYFTNYDEMKAWKRKWDPHNVFLALGPD